MRKRTNQPLATNMDEEKNQSAIGNTFFDEIKQLYYRDEFSHLVQQWNIQRSESLKRALYQILYPQIEKELRVKLATEAREGVLRACAHKLYDWLKVAPYQMDQQVEDEFDESNNERGLKVLGISFSTSYSTPAFGALINGDASVVEFIKMDNLTKRKNSRRDLEQKEKAKDLKKLKKFIAEKRPHVVAVASEVLLQALMIIDDIKAILFELEGEQQMQDEFREYPAPPRHAISIARRLQNRLFEFAQLCNPDEDILCLKYHPLQFPRKSFWRPCTWNLSTELMKLGWTLTRCLTSHTQPHCCSLFVAWDPGRHHRSLKIPYLMSASKKYPGKFLLSYMPCNLVQHEYVSARPDGIKFRNHIFRSVNSMIRWFKEHFRDPVPACTILCRSGLSKEGGWFQKRICLTKSAAES